MTAYDKTKRLVDLSAATIALLAAAPLSLLVAILILLTMGRPVLFKQIRPGVNAVPFELIKFRTMRTPKPGETDLVHDRVRLTKLGKILRETSLDELPTFINVLKGDMSLIGPRPLLMQYLSLYSKEQARRHEVKPGITGWAQVNGRNNITWQEKFELDLWYVDNRSVWVDLKIMALTFLRVLRRDGIALKGTATTREFKGNETE